ncbi:MAG: polysaccharide deacetylase family protein [Bacteroidales bacterium]|nr:polysaccharide deacetylase family protein [Bacteroidales bacterium]
MYVVMLHSVGNDKSPWSRRWLSVSLDHFETLCRYLAEKKYTTHFLNEWYGYFSAPRSKDPGKLVLTFDDGYLDNWVFAFPLLKKYGLKATVFVNPEFVDPGQQLRPNLEDVWAGRIAEDEMQTLGFLNWPEICAMQQSGIIDIQSHSMSHNLYFRTNTVIDAYNGQPRYDWLPWITHPERKSFYIAEDQKDLVPACYPVFEYGRALGLRRYLPDEQLIKGSIELAGKGISDKNEMINRLQKLTDQFPGRYETDDEIVTRYRYELFESKRILQEKLNKKVDFLCWPGGGFNELSLHLSKEAGYKASTLGSSVDGNTIDNTHTYKRIPRIGLSSFVVCHKGQHYINDKAHLVKLLKSRTGNLFLKLALKIKKEVIKKAVL